VDESGLPLALVVSGANVPDVKALTTVLESLQIERFSSTQRPKLCADAGYWGLWPYYAIVEHGYEPQIINRRQDLFRHAHEDGYRSHRYVVEACHSWLNRYRKILVRFEKTLRAHFALLCFAAANIVWQRIISR
jgi:transposase